MNVRCRAPKNAALTLFFWLVTIGGVYANSGGTISMRYDPGPGEDGRPFSIEYQWAYATGLEDHRVSMTMTGNTVTAGGRRYTQADLQRIFAARAERDGTKVGVENQLRMYGPASLQVEATVEAGGRTARMNLSFGFAEASFSGSGINGIGWNQSTLQALGIDRDEFERLTRSGEVRVTTARIVDVTWNNWVNNLSETIADAQRPATTEEAASSAGNQSDGAQSQAANVTRLSAQRRTRAPQAPQSSYNWQRDYAAFQQDTARIQQMGDTLTSAMDQTFSAIRNWQEQQQRQRRWEAAASLNTSGQSPEQMIRQVEQQQRELEQLAAERRAELQREMEEMRRKADQAIQNANTEAEAIAGGVMGLAAIAGEVGGSAAINRQQRQANQELERQLTEAFREIQRDITRDIDSSIDIAMQGKAQTLFPEQFAYFEEVIAYYSDYKRQIDSGFTIRNTDWMYPQGRRPREPRLGSRPDYTTATISSLMRNKWAMLEQREPYSDETRDSLYFLTGVAIDRFQRRPEPYYYRSLLTDDVIDRYLLSRQADKLGNDQVYSRKAQQDRVSLSTAFFEALSANNRSMIRRVWQIGLATELRNVAGEGAYLYSLSRNTNALDYLLGLESSSERRRLAQSLLVLAASKGLVDGIDVLIDRGADPERRDGSTGATPVLAAASEGQLGAVSHLSDNHGVNARAAFDDANRLGFDAARFHLARYLFGQAVSRNQPSLIGNALVYEAAVVHTTYRGGTSYLGYAAANDRRLFLEAAFDAGISPNATDPRGVSIIGVAMEGNAEDETIRLLAGAGASLEAVDSDGRTLLHWAAEITRPQLVSYLLSRGAPTRQADNFGRLPLHAAATGLPNREFEQVLGATGTVDVPDNEGNTPIHVALSAARADRAFRMLVFADSVDVQNDQGASYLHLAVTRAPQLVTTLLDVGAKVDAMDVAGNSPLHLAITNDRNREALAILAAGADLTMQNAVGRTPLHEAIEDGDPAWPSMVGNGAALRLTDAEGNTPIHQMLQRDWRRTAGFIWRFQPPADTPNAGGATYLHLAARNGDRTTVEALLANGASLDLIDAEGNTALHLAARAGALETAMVLLQAGADPAARNAGGNTPSVVAGDEGHDETERFIRLYRRNPRYFRRVLRTTLSSGDSRGQ